MSKERDEQLALYRDHSIRELLEVLLDGSYEPSTMRQVLFEKVDELENHCSPNPVKGRFENIRTREKMSKKRKKDLKKKM